MLAFFISNQIKFLYFVQRKINQMKKISVAIFTSIIFMSACKEEIKKENSAPTVYPYPISYSADFEIGDSKLINKVLDLWTAYDNNKVSTGIALFADSVSLQFPNGIVIHTSKDSMIATITKDRGKHLSANSSVVSAVALKAKGKDETWVSIWGKEVDVEPDGTKDSTLINENWFFNKDGKAFRMQQYAGKAPK
jgi:hypothetical protein